MSHNKYYGTGLPTFTHRSVNQHLRKGPRRYRRYTSSYNDAVVYNDGVYICALKERVGNPSSFTALDALEAYLSGHFYNKPCLPGFFKALCSMVTPQVARQLYFRATGRYGNFRKGSGLFHALDREVVSKEEFLRKHFLPVLRNAVR